MSQCNCCGLEDSDLRMGCCFDCATKGEERALRRTVLQHIAKGLSHLASGYWMEARFDFKWAWERLTRTGDYEPDGYADWQVPDWRGEQCGIILPHQPKPRARARGSRILIAGLAGAVLAALSWWAFGTMVPGWIGAAVLGVYIGRGGR